MTPGENSAAARSSSIASTGAAGAAGASLPFASSGGGPSVRLQACVSPDPTPARRALDRRPVRRVADPADVPLPRVSLLPPPLRAASRWLRRTGVVCSDGVVVVAAAAVAGVAARMPLHRSAPSPPTDGSPSEQPSSPVHPIAVRLTGRGGAGVGTRGVTAAAAGASAGGGAVGDGVACKKVTRRGVRPSDSRPAPRTGPPSPGDARQLRGCRNGAGGSGVGVPASNITLRSPPSSCAARRTSTSVQPDRFSAVVPPGVTPAARCVATGGAASSQPREQRRGCATGVNAPLAPPETSSLAVRASGVLAEAPAGEAAVIGTTAFTGVSESARWRRRALDIYVV